MTKDKKEKAIKDTKKCPECEGKLNDEGNLCEDCGAEIEPGDMEDTEPDMHKATEEVALDGWDDDETDEEEDDGLYS